jgi:DNA ligase-1
MERFSRLYEALEQTSSTNAKVQALKEYFREVSPADGAWAVYFLSSRRPKRLVGSARLRQWLVAYTGLPDWLVEECYNAVGDLAETIALLAQSPYSLDLPIIKTWGACERSVDGLDGRSQASAREVFTASSGTSYLSLDPKGSNLSLSQWLTEHILPLRDRPEAEQQTVITQWWAQLPQRQCYLVNKLLTGSLRVGVSQTLVIRAIAELAGLERSTIAQRLAGHWQPEADFYQKLFAADSEDNDISRPYPFFLASPLDKSPVELGAVEQFLVEWKWDGIRAQVIRRADETFVWTRGEELVSERFPEIRDAAAQNLPDGTVLDGEILAWRDTVLPFAELQQRIGRKRVGKTLLAKVPVAFLAYDLLEQKGTDIRSWPLAERRHALNNLLQEATPPLLLSQALTQTTWEALAALREQSHERRVEGLMVKRRDSAYGTGRKKGSWWKWKVDPYTLDAVLLYAQAGHGRRANLFTDYTFAVWEGETLVPIAKAYSGLTDEEIQRLDRWIRRNTQDRFGPVRSVNPQHVFELAFEGISHSSRHRSGIALRFPRISRWRTDLGIRDADTLDQVKALLDAKSA